MEQEVLVISVSDLTDAIKRQLEGAFPYVCVQGEISNSKLHSSGHFYFSLKDTHAQIGGAMFRAHASKMRQLPKDGDAVVVKGEINVYPPHGKYQIIAREIEQVGMGQLLLKLEQLKAELQRRGWFDPKHKKPLPMIPKRIGVVTSPTGAAIRDILNILKRRFSGFHLILNPVRVQGETAAKEIAQAIEQFNQHQLADVLIVGRGGGSIEDLWAFNEEVVARAIFESTIPIISAVGHETDTCLSDLVADVRAPTPSAAAEIAMAKRSEQLDYLQQQQRRLFQTVHHLIKHCQQRLQGVLKQPVLSTPYGILAPWMQKLDTLKEGINQAVQQRIQHKSLVINGLKKQLSSLQPQAKIAHMKQRLLGLEQGITQGCLGQIRQKNERLAAKQKRQQLMQTFQRTLKFKKERLEQLTAALQAINPKNLLKKGYSILFSEKHGSVITSVDQVSCDDTIKNILSDGTIVGTVKEIKP